MHRQRLLILSEADLNELLDKGARVVWISHISLDQYRVVLETVKELEFTPSQAILEFLGSVDTRALEQQLLEREMDDSLGDAVVTILAKAAVDGTA